MNSSNEAENSPDIEKKIQAPNHAIVPSAASNDEAAGQIFLRYVDRLTRLAQSRLSEKLAARVDADDIVMSAYRSFFMGMRRGQFVIDQSEDLWRLLVEITLHKLYRQAKHHQAERRSINREQSVAANDSQAWQPTSAEPSPETAAALSDELEQIMARLSPTNRHVLELRLQGEDLATIAAVIGRNERTVRRLLNEIKILVRGRFSELWPRQKPTNKGVDRDRQKANKAKLPSKPPRTRRSKSDPEAPLDFQDFILHEQIGNGATGKVYRATQKSLSRAVAIKYLKKTWTSNLRVVNRFRDEAKIVAKLSHQGIVRVLGLGRTPNGGYFIAMQFVAGGDLGQRLKSNLVSVAEAVRWVREIAEAMAYAHQQGIVHCDLKPGNVLIDEASHALVTDFGFAQQIERSGAVMKMAGGTPAFMAPEQIDPCYGEIGPSTDIYGVGAILFALLTGKPPFEGARLADVLAKVVDAESARVPDVMSKEVPKSLIDICNNCLRKDSSQRFTTMEELAERLRAEEASPFLGNPQGNRGDGQIHSIDFTEALQKHGR